MGERGEVVVLVDYLKFLLHPDNNTLFLSIINVPARDVSKPGTGL